MAHPLDRQGSHRRRIDTPSLRGVNIQRLFGSQRALKSVEDFTEFEQRAAYFDGDPVSATAKGVNVLERGSQVHFMAEFQELLDFPPAPGLGLDGTEVFEITGIDALNDGKTPKTVHVKASKDGSDAIEFDAVVRIDTPGEADYYRNGGILPYVLRSLAGA